jgi:adenine-specific DNA-methyltransferase
VPFVERLRGLPCRLVDYGYGVSTGPLVWNRHKDQIHQDRVEPAYPLVWAECISASGFAYKAEKRSHAPWFCTRPGQEHLLTDRPSLLVQRTTAKEQSRRIIAARTPDYLFAQYGNVVVENHLNIVQATRVSEFGLRALQLLLTHPCVDAAFRCLSGSVAVSAYELEAIPLPPVELALEWAARLESDGDELAFGNAVGAYYGCD